MERRLAFNRRRRKAEPRTPRWGAHGSRSEGAEPLCITVRLQRNGIADGVALKRQCDRGAPHFLPYQEPFLFYWAGVLKTAGIDTRSRNFAEDVGTQILWLVGPAGTIAVGQLRGNLQDDGSCALCSQESETIFHLLVVSCSFARREVCWYGVLLLIGHYPRSFWVHTNSST